MVAGECFGGRLAATAPAEIVRPLVDLRGPSFML